MTTYGQLVDYTLLKLNAYSTSQDQMTTLVNSIGTTDTALTILEPSQVSRGLLEIDDELLFAQSVDLTSAIVTIPPWGRGYRGSIAASHAANARITSTPTFPRQQVKDAINESVLGVYPYLAKISSTEITVATGVSTYSMPTGVEKVLSVSYNPQTVAGEWLPVRRYRVEAEADTTSFATGCSLTILDQLNVGAVVRVITASMPSQLSNESDDFTTVTGLGPSTVDVVGLGAAWRLMQFIDVPRLFGNSAEADFGGQNRPVGGANAIVRQIYQIYKDRLADEALIQSKLHTIRSHYSN